MAFQVSRPWNDSACVRFEAPLYQFTVDEGRDQVVLGRVSLSPNTTDWPPIVWWTRPDRFSGNKINIEKKNEKKSASSSLDLDDITVQGGYTVMSAKLNDEVTVEIWQRRINQPDGVFMERCRDKKK